MHTTARIARPLLGVAAATLALSTAPAHAAQTERCPDARQIPTAQSDLRKASKAVRCLVNAERATRGLKTLRRDRDLARAARRHAADMTERRYFSHVSPGGSDLKDRLRRADYGKPGAGWSAGENLGWGTGDRATPAAMVDAWLASEGHKRNMLGRRFREVGVGVARGAPQPSGGLPGATYTLVLGVTRSG